MLPSSLTDTEIVDYLKSGNQRRVNALTAQLLIQWRGIVVNLVMQYQGDLSLDVAPVLDLALAHFIRNVQSDIYQLNRSAATTYFHSIVRHNLLNRLRRDRAWHARHGNLDELSDLSPSTDEDTNRLLESEENRKKILGAILKLDKSCQKVLRDYWWGNKSLKEIAESLDSSWDATKQKHHRCLAQLRKLLDNRPDE